MRFFHLCHHPSHALTKKTVQFTPTYALIQALVHGLWRTVRVSAISVTKSIHQVSCYYVAEPGRTSMIREKMKGVRALFFLYNVFQMGVGGNRRMPTNQDTWPGRSYHDHLVCLQVLEVGLLSPPSIKPKMPGICHLATDKPVMLIEIISIFRMAAYYWITNNTHTDNTYHPHYHTSNYNSTNSH